MGQQDRWRSSALRQFDQYFGKGTGGAHGGSGLSSLGGSIRLGELLPGSPPINHALKIELANWWYYGEKQLQPKTIDNQGRSQYLWPATGSNAGFNPETGKSNGNYVGKKSVCRARRVTGYTQSTGETS